MRSRTYCIAYGCLNSTRRNPHLTFFRLPRKSERREKFLNLIRRQDLLERKNLNPYSYAVCSAHFEDSAMKTIRQLHENALPSLFPAQSTSALTKDKAEALAARKLEDESNGQLNEHHEKDQENDTQHITEAIKIETPDDVDLSDDECETPAAQPEDVDTILGSDDGADRGFSPFVQPKTANCLPVINVFAVMEFIATNNHYSTLNYRKLKDVVIRKGFTKENKLLSGLQVQNRKKEVFRVRGTVHLQTSSQCALEYDVSTDTRHTVTRSECMACPLATCPHVAALLMWLYTVTSTRIYNPKYVADDDDTSTGTTEHVTEKAGDAEVAVQLQSQSAVTVRAGAGEPVAEAPGLGHPVAPGLEDPVSAALGLEDPVAGTTGLEEPMAGAPGPGDEDEAQLAIDEIPGPPTAKRKKMALSKMTPRYTATISITKSVPKETDEDNDDSMIKGSFTRKCFFDVWRSTTGSSTERVAHTRTIMTEAFRDPEYVIDFQPLERRLELLCTELEGYWNGEAKKTRFENKYVEWLAVTEYIEMKKQKRI